jgi:hypothetical protein
LEKLTFSQRRIFYQCNPKINQCSLQQKWDILFDFLKQEKVQALEYAPLTFKKKEKLLVNKVNFPHSPNIATTPSTSNTQRSNSPGGNCFFCKGDTHSTLSYFCPVTQGKLDSKLIDRFKSDKRNCLTCLKKDCPGLGGNCRDTQYACRKGCLIDGVKANYRLCDCTLQKNLHNNLNAKNQVKIKSTKLASTTSFGKTLMLTESVNLILADGSHKKVTIFHDSGATDSIIRKDLEKCGISSEKLPEHINISGYGGKFCESDPKAVKLNFLTLLGKDQITAVTVDNLDGINPVVVKVPGRWRRHFDKSSFSIGPKVDILVGGNACHLFPDQVDSYSEGGQTMKLYRSKLTGKYLLYGFNPNQVFPKSSSTKVCKVMVDTTPSLLAPAQQVIKNERERSSSTSLTIDQPVEKGIEKMTDLRTLDNDGRLDKGKKNEDKKSPRGVHWTDSGQTDNILFDEFKGQNMAALTAMDKTFRTQLTCETFQERNWSKRQSEEEEILKKNIVYDSSTKQWTTSFLYSERIKSLLPNENVVKKRMIAVNNKLLKNQPLAAAANAEVEKNIAAGYWKPVTEGQFPPDAQKHLIPFSFVSQPQSKSTPVRVVVDPSCRDQNGLCLNQCQRSGYNNIGNLKGCLLRFRTAQNVAVGDLQKFFHSFILSKTDQSLHRVLIPEGGFGKTANPIFTEYFLAHVGFGDKLSPTVSILSRDKNTATFLEKSPENFREKVKSALETNAYVDDVHCDTAWTESIDSLIKAIESVVDPGGMAFKEWRKAGEPGEGSYLGHWWNSLADTLQLKNWAQGGGKMSELTLENVEKAVMLNFTKRKALSVVAQLYDPLLLLAPIVVKLRLYYHKVCTSQKHLTWDLQLDTSLKEEFVEIFKLVHEMKNFKVPRSVIPRNISSPRPEGEFFVFTDGSLEAFAACLYVRFEVGDKIHSNLLTSSLKIAGSRRLTAPQSELLGAELGVKMLLQTMEETKNNVNILKTTFITDSRIILAQLRRPSANYDVFTGSRIAFIQDNINIDNWIWCPGEENSADIPTRKKATIEEINSDKWRYGGFLVFPKDQWPTKEFSEHDVLDNLPESKETLLVGNMKVKKTKVSQETGSPWKRLMQRHRSLDTVVSIMAFLLKWRHNLPLARLKERAMNVLIQETMESTKLLLSHNKPKQVEIEEEDNIVYVKPRTLENILQAKLVLIDIKSPFGRLLSRHFHDASHLRGVRAIQAKIQEAGYYIPYSSSSLVAEKANCQVCKKIIHTPGSQRMGDMKRQRFIATKPFEKIYIDHAGPFRSFDQVKRRTTAKCWALIVSCAFTRCTMAYCTADLTTDSVIQALHRHKARFGDFKEVFSDQGTSLVAASLVDQPPAESEEIQVQELKDHFRGVQWYTGIPKAPWGTGCAEAAVKLFKQQLQILQVTEGHKKLSALEYETLFLRASYMVNQRPVVLAAEPGTSLCSNSVIHGFNPPVLEPSTVPETNLTRRNAAVEESLKTFWEIYSADFSKKATMLPKWRHQEENLRVGDIVLLLDSPTKVGSYRLGEVIEVHPDNRGLVRTVTLEVITPTGRFNRMQRSVHTLSKMTHWEQPDQDQGDEPEEDDESDEGGEGKEGREGKEGGEGEEGKEDEEVYDQHTDQVTDVTEQPVNKKNEQVENNVSIPPQQSLEENSQVNPTPETDLEENNQKVSLLPKQSSEEDPGPTGSRTRNKTILKVNQGIPVGEINDLRKPRGRPRK